MRGRRDSKGAARDCSEESEGICALTVLPEKLLLWRVDVAQSDVHEPVRLEERLEPGELRDVGSRQTQKEGYRASVQVSSSLRSSFSSLGPLVRGACVHLSVGCGHRSNFVMAYRGLWSIEILDVSIAATGANHTSAPRRVCPGRNEGSVHRLTACASIQIKHASG